MENANSHEYLEKIKIAIIENLKKTAPVPSVQMTDIPRQSLGLSDEEEAELDDLDEDENKDVRMTQRRWEKTVARQDEYEDSDDEDMAQANGVHTVERKRPSILDHPNPYADVDMDSGLVTPVAAASPQPNGAADVSNAEPEEVTMEDADASAPTEAAEVAEAAEAVEEAAKDDSKVDNDGDVDMGEADAPVSDKPEIKKEEIEGQQSVGGADAEKAKSAEPTTEAESKTQPAAEKQKSPSPSATKAEPASETDATKEADKAEEKKTDGGTEKDTSKGTEEGSAAAVKEGAS